MISNCCTDTNRQILFKSLGENLLPAAQACWLSWTGSAVAAPGTRNRHINLFGHLIPGQPLVTKFQDLLCRDGMSGEDRSNAW
jgi:hypothetical protein